MRCWSLLLLVVVVSVAPPSRRACDVSGLASAARDAARGRGCCRASLVDGCRWLSRRILGRPWEYRDDFGALHNDVHWQREAAPECDDARPQRESRWEVHAGVVKFVDGPLVVTCRSLQPVSLTCGGPAPIGKERSSGSELLKCCCRLASTFARSSLPPQPVNSIAASASERSSSAGSHDFAALGGADRVGARGRPLRLQIRQAFPFKQHALPFADNLGVVDHNDVHSRHVRPDLDDACPKCALDSHGDAKSR